jgi:hypothetical protein
MLYIQSQIFIIAALLRQVSQCKKRRELIRQRHFVAGETEERSLSLKNVLMILDFSLITRLFNGKV